MESSSTWVRSRTHYNQYDSRWANDKMGAGILKKKGCLVSSIAMILHSRGCKIDGGAATPATLNAWLKKNKGYSGDSFIWKSADSLGLKFSNHTTDNETIRQCLRDTSYDVILELNKGHYNI